MATTPDAVTAPLRFGACELHPAARELRVDGVPARVGERGFDLLLALAEARGELVTRDVLLGRVWRGTVVGDENLKVQVMALRKLIGAQAIVTVPGRGYRLGLPVHDGAAPPAAAPVPSGLIGRGAEIESLLASLAPGALVTLVGPGGVGKTRLARAAADAARPRFADGACIVELASLADPSLLPATVARALDLPPLGASPSAERVARAVTPLALLVVLDNCEHLLDAAATMAQALHAAAPRAALLATSQQPLGLGDEQVRRLGGLAIEVGDGADGPDGGAAALFTARVRRVDPQFVPDQATREAIATICRRLDGLPLAIELAAARVPLLGVRGVLERVDQQLPLLAGGARDAPARHQTLRAAMQWSHALLDAREQRLFRRLGVFADTFTLESAVTVEGEDPDWTVVDTLGALVDKSLVQTLDVLGRRRFRLLVTARDFALEHLADAGELATTRARHARAVIGTFEAAEREFLGARLGPWVDALMPELPDLRAALQWAAGPAGSAETLLALVGAAGTFWGAGLMLSEAMRWLDAARPHVDDTTPAPLAAGYWRARATWAMDPAVPIHESVAAARRAADLLRDLGDVHSEYRMLSLRIQHARRVEPELDVQPLLERMRALEQPDWTHAMRWSRHRTEGFLMARAGDWNAYRDRFAAEARLLEEVGDEVRLWGALHHVALADIALGQAERAVRLLAPMVERIRALGLLRRHWSRLAIWMVARIEAGHGRDAAPAMRELVALLQVADVPDWICDHQAWWLAQCDAWDDSARLIGWADASYERRKESRHSHGQAALARTLEVLRPRLDAARLDALRSEGRLLPDEVALQILQRVADSVGA